MQNNLAVRTSDREHTAPRVVELDFGAQIFIWSLRHAFHFGEMAVRPGLFQVLGKQHIDEGVAMFLNLGEILQSDSERLTISHNPGQVTLAKTKSTYCVPPPSPNIMSTLR